MKGTYKDSSLSINQRVVDLLSQMTLDEKLAQVVGVWKNAQTFLSEQKELNVAQLQVDFPHGLGQIGRVLEGCSATQMAELSNEIQKYFVEQTRLGIPLLFHEECLHGVMEVDAISFPHPIALASSFNTDLVQQMYSFVAKDARARGSRLALTPVLDVVRDPRWGRVEETFGEDPYLVSRMAISAVLGFQGKDNDTLPEDKVMATLKHFAAHGQPEGGTNCAPANYSERILREVFLFPFKEVIKHTKPKSVMASYNEIDGVPSHCNSWLLQDILRKEYGFDGFVVSDYYGVEQLEERHYVVGDLKQAAYEALKAGVDIELPEPYAYVYLKELIEEGTLDLSYLNIAVSRLLYYKFYAGLFDNPYVDPTKAKSISEDTHAVQLSYLLAAESAILLKNQNNTLPLPVNTNKTIAVIGPNATYHSIGGYSCPNSNFITILDGIKKSFKNATVTYAKGCGITQDGGSWFKDEVYRTSEAEDLELIQEAIVVAKESDVIVLCVGGNEQTNREGWNDNHLGDRPSLEMVGLQNTLFAELSKLGKQIIVVLNHGAPIAITDITEKADAILDCWYLGQETGRVVADILNGTINPSGKLPISIPRSAGHIPSFYNYKPTARRGYLFDDVTPLYSFGYGLSYTTFALSQYTIESISKHAEHVCKIGVQIQNTGDCAGSEVVQVYIRDVVSSVTRPVEELKRFKKVFLEKGQTEMLEFYITKEDLSFYNRNMEFVFESGEFEFMIGTNSKDVYSLFFCID